MTNCRDILGWLVVLAVGLPLLLLAYLAQLASRSARKTKPDEREVRTMSDPFDGHPPQGVVFECRKPNCSLQHEATVDQFSDVEDTVRFYITQGHQAQARFPAADDATWPPENTSLED